MLEEQDIRNCNKMQTSGSLAAFRITEELLKTNPKTVSMVMEYGGFGVSAEGLAAFAEKE